MPKTYGRGKLVDTFQFKDYGAVPVYFQKRNGQFTAEVYGEDYTAASVADLRKALELALTENRGLDWQGAIEVSMVSDGRDDESEAVVGLEYERFYWTRRPDGQTLRAWWGKYPDDDSGVSADDLLKRARGWEWNHARDGAPFKPPCTYKGYSGAETWFIPYSAAVWAGLAQLVEAIKGIRRRVVEIVSTPAGHEILQSASVFLLAAPADKESTDGR